MKCSEWIQTSKTGDQLYSNISPYGECFPLQAFHIERQISVNFYATWQQDVLRQWWSVNNDEWYTLKNDRTTKLKKRIETEEGGSGTDTIKLFPVTMDLFGKWVLPACQRTSIFNNKLGCFMKQVYFIKPPSFLFSGNSLGRPVTTLIKELHVLTDYRNIVLKNLRQISEWPDARMQSRQCFPKTWLGSFSI